YAAFTLFHNAINGGQAQTCSFSYLLGSEEGLKNMGLGFFVHAAPGIADREHYVPARFGVWVLADIELIEFCICRLDQQLSTLRHCVSGIDRKIHQDLLHLPSIRLHIFQLAITNNCEINVFANKTAQHLSNIRYQRVQVEYGWLYELFAAEG